MKTKEERNAYAREWYKRNKEKSLAYSKKWMLENKDKVAAIQKRYRDSDRKRFLFRSNKYNAKKRGIEHTLLYEDIVWPTHCPLLGVELNYRTVGREDYGISLDRIDNTQGYVKGNVQVLSLKANVMKYSASKEELIAFAKGVLAFYT